MREFRLQQFSLDTFVADECHFASSSKSALHGLVHWLAGAYAKKGLTMNGVAPALIEETKMLPGASAELSASEFAFKQPFRTWLSRRTTDSDSYW
jgi:NAD(P)-dependent dehydrogenase (short-subunit alcohol dehydrogenase family)